MIKGGEKTRQTRKVSTSFVPEKRSLAPDYMSLHRFFYIFLTSWKGEALVFFLFLFFLDFFIQK